jgi:hypothetical protein
VRNQAKLRLVPTEPPSVDLPRSAPLADRPQEIVDDFTPSARRRAVIALGWRLALFGVALLAVAEIVFLHR